MISEYAHLELEVTVYLLLAYFESLRSFSNLEYQWCSSRPSRCAPGNSLAATFPGPCSWCRGLHCRYLRHSKVLPFTTLNQRLLDGRIDECRWWLKSSIPMIQWQFRCSKILNNGCFNPANFEDAHHIDTMIEPHEPKLNGRSRSYSRRCRNATWSGSNEHIVLAIRLEENFGRFFWKKKIPRNFLNRITSLTALWFWVFEFSFRMIVIIEFHIADSIMILSFRIQFSNDNYFWVFLLRDVSETTLNLLRVCMLLDF
jgi:hypothetical protein